MKKRSEVSEVLDLDKMIFTIRGQRVMLDSDLAKLFGVSTGRVNETVKRNRVRFPQEFMFVLTRQEFTNLISQFATSSSWGGRRNLPKAFTEHGAIMLANVLNSPRAIEASIYVVKAFVRLREILYSHKEFVAKLVDLERKVLKHDKDKEGIIIAIRQLMTPPSTTRRRIGFSKD